VVHVRCQSSDARRRPATRGVGPSSIFIYVHRAVALVALLLITGCASGTGRQALPSSARTLPGTRLLVVGDSLSAGYFASSMDRSFPRLLARDLEAIGMKVAPTVVAHAGATARDAGYWKVAIPSDIVVVELGTNDWGTAMPLEQFRTEYRDLLRLVESASPRATLICTGAWADKTEINPLGLTVLPYDSVVQQQCAERHGQYVDLVATYSDPANHGPGGRRTFLGLSDWFHPNDLGHHALADAVMTTVPARGALRFTNHG
jgi:acyl-CoA thioesterase I